jgi:hypothetical protein
MAAPLGLGPEIAGIHEQIERARGELAALRSELKQRSAQYRSELERL